MKEQIVKEPVLEEIKTQKKYRKRLFLGEGNFSYALAVVKKQFEKGKYELGKFIYATEYESEENLRNFHRDDFEKNIRYLKDQGAKISFNVDARNSKTFPKGNFSRIHFNCPFPTDNTGGNSRQLIYHFFKNIGSIQKEGDKVYMVLALGNKKEANIKLNEINTYGTFEPATRFGYEPVTPRKFDNIRYKEYKHSRSMGGKRKPTSAAQANYLREYVFIKTNKLKEQITQEFKEKYQLESLPIEKAYGNIQITAYPPLKEEEDSSHYSSQECYSDNSENDEEILDRTEKNHYSTNEEKTPKKRTIDISSPSPSNINEKKRKLNFTQEKAIDKNQTSLSSSIQPFALSSPPKDSLNKTPAKNHQTTKRDLEDNIKFVEEKSKKYETKKETIEKNIEILEQEVKEVLIENEKKIEQIKLLQKEIEGKNTIIKEKNDEIESFKNNELSKFSGKYKKYLFFHQLAVEKMTAIDNNNLDISINTTSNAYGN